MKYVLQKSSIANLSLSPDYIWSLDSSSEPPEPLKLMYKFPNRMLVSSYKNHMHKTRRFLSQKIFQQGDGSTRLDPLPVNSI